MNSCPTVWESKKSCHGDIGGGGGAAPFPPETSDVFNAILLMQSEAWRPLFNLRKSKHRGRNHQLFNATPEGS